MIIRFLSNSMNIVKYIRHRESPVYYHESTWSGDHDAQQLPNDWGRKPSPARPGVCIPLEDLANASIPSLAIEFDIPAKNGYLGSIPPAQGVTCIPIANGFKLFHYYHEKFHVYGILII